jgi:hypothetical protein
LVSPIWLWLHVIFGRARCESFCIGSFLVLLNRVLFDTMRALAVLVAVAATLVSARPFDLNIKEVTSFPENPSYVGYKYFSDDACSEVMFSATFLNDVCVSGTGGSEKFTCGKLFMYACTACEFLMDIFVWPIVDTDHSVLTFGIYSDDSCVTPASDDLVVTWSADKCRSSSGSATTTDQNYVITAGGCDATNPIHALGDGDFVAQMYEADIAFMLPMLS